MEKKRQSMHIKLARSIQTDSRRTNWQGGSIFSAVWTQACSPPLLLLWEVAGVRGGRREVEGWGDGVIDTQSMRTVQTRTQGQSFRIFPSWGVSNKCIYRIDLDDRPKLCKTCVYTQKRFHVDGPLNTKLKTHIIYITSYYKHFCVLPLFLCCKYEVSILRHFAWYLVSAVVSVCLSAATAQPLIMTNRHTENWLHLFEQWMWTENGQRINFNLLLSQVDRRDTAITHCC